jgi:FkbM family methyltransferase
VTVVIDIGCARHGGDYSIERLIEEYHPHELYGYDPSPGSVLSWMPDEHRAGPVVDPEQEVGAGYLDTEATGLRKIELHRKAAWTYDGEIGYRADGLNSWVTELRGAPKVPCVDIDRIVREHGEGHLDVILKIDAEGSEYDLLRHLMATGGDKIVTLAVIEWHEPDRGRALIEKEFAAPVQEWPW